MNAEGEYLAQSVANRQNIVENSWRETHQDRAAQTETPINEKTISNEGSFIFPTSVITIVLVAFIGIFLKRLKPLKPFNKPSIEDNYFRQASCHRCRFFNNNSYLKCAVHPCTVLTSEAKNCSDYWPYHQKDFFSH